MSTHELSNPILYRNEFQRIAREKFGSGSVQDVLIENDVDLDGEPCLRITFVLKSNSILRTRGERLGEIGLTIRHFLDAQHDPRLPFVHYATQGELSEFAAQDD